MDAVSDDVRDDSWQHVGRHCHVAMHGGDDGVSLTVVAVLGHDGDVAAGHTCAVDVVTMPTMC